MNRGVFFGAVRQRPFGGSITQSQVDGINAILDEWEKQALTDLRWLAYMLATSYHETGHTMLPITEYGAVSYFDKYDVGTKIGRALGNTEKGDGYRFRGRGYVQLTGRANYVKASHELSVDLIRDPEKALDKTVAAQIMFRGMIEGWFTGKKLSDYFSAGKTDWVEARRIINGTDRATMIGGYAQDFHNALQASALPDVEWHPDQPVAPPHAPPDVPASPPPKPPIPPSKPPTGAIATGASLGLIALIIALWDKISSFFHHLF